MRDLDVNEFIFVVSGWDPWSVKSRITTPKHYIYFAIVLTVESLSESMQGCNRVYEYISSFTVKLYLKLL